MRSRRITWTGEADTDLTVNELRDVKELVFFRDGEKKPTVLKLTEAPKVNVIRKGA